MPSYFRQVPGIKANGDSVAWSGYVLSPISTQLLKLKKSPRNLYLCFLHNVF